MARIRGGRIGGRGHGRGRGRGLGRGSEPGIDNLIEWASQSTRNRASQRELSPSSVSVGNDDEKLNARAGSQ